MPDRIGQQIGDYGLVSLLGSKGFAEVYLGRLVQRPHVKAAIKFLHTKPGYIYQAWFLQEATIIASLNHPHIIRLLGFGIEEADNTPYLIMEYAPGRSLRDRHRRGEQLSLPTIVSYVHQIADALQYAHDQGVIHRDLKPENVLIGTNGEVMLSDFGMAAIAYSSTLMDDYVPMDAVPYAAPEQIQGKPRPESDQYALGVMVYEWVTGKQPFTGNMQTILLQHLGIEPVPPHEHAASISPEVEIVIMRALAKEPQQRFGSIQEFAMAFEQASHVPVPPESFLPRRREFRPLRIASPRSMLLGAIALLMVFLSIFIGLAVSTTHRNMVATATAPQVSATATAGNAAFATMTATAQANASATAQSVSATATGQANPTVTTQPGAATVTAPANPYGGTLALSVSLSDPSHDAGWPVVTDEFGTCQFLGGAYQLNTVLSSYAQWCDASPAFSDFAYEVQMKILQGDMGGITFRADSALNMRYIFSIGQNGTFKLAIAQGTIITRVLIQPTFSQAIHRDLGRMNVIAVVARGNAILLFVNRQQVARVVDGTSSHGLLGLVASTTVPGRYVTEVVFSDVRVWTF